MEEDLGSFEALERIVATLRGPDGCPWDREQTHASLKPNLLEECYEVLEAIDDGDKESLCEELGDLLMQVMLHTQIASEAGEFEMMDVIRNISEKLIRRHPHVFGDVKLGSANEVVIKWEALKRDELPPGKSLLSGVPHQMPALAYSHSIQRRAALAGFDWGDIDGVLDKLYEEIEELKGASSHEQRAYEFGDLLFSVVNVARWMGIDPEGALREANKHFRRRFEYMEELCLGRGEEFTTLSFEEQNRLWEEAKKKLGG